MGPEISGKRTLQPSRTPMTSNSSTQSSTSRGELTFSQEVNKGKGIESQPSHGISAYSLAIVITYNPLLSPSALLDPKVLERKQKVLGRK